MTTEMEAILCRTDNADLKPKLRKIARKESRSLSRQVEFILLRFVEQYEKRHGVIKID